MLEAMAMQMPIVGYPARSFGLAGPGAALSGRAEPGEFADTSWLLERPSARAGSRGRPRVVEQE